MKKILIVMMMLLLTGCSHNYNEAYYREQVDAYDIELEVRLVSFSNIHLDNNERIVRVEYVEHYEEFQFRPITIYAFCVVSNCEEITLNEYLIIKEE